MREFEDGWINASPPAPDYCSPYFDLVRYSPGNTANRLWYSVAQSTFNIISSGWMPE